MFYSARALLESEGVKFSSDQSIHALVFDALVYYFYLTNKLQKHFIEDFAEARDEASELLSQQRAKELIEEYDFERKKRATFTYVMGAVAMQNKAGTSLERAEKLNEEIRKMLKDVK